MEIISHSRKNYKFLIQFIFKLNCSTMKPIGCRQNLCLSYSHLSTNVKSCWINSNKNIILRPDDNLRTDISILLQPLDTTSFSYFFIFLPSSVYYDDKHLLFFFYVSKSLVRSLPFSTMYIVEVLLSKWKSNLIFTVQCVKFYYDACRLFYDTYLQSHCCINHGSTIVRWCHIIIVVRWN